MYELKEKSTYFWIAPHICARVRVRAGVCVFVCEDDCLLDILSCVFKYCILQIKNILVLNLYHIFSLNITGLDNLQH